MAPPAFHLQLAPLIESPALPGCCTCCLATLRDFPPPPGFRLRLAPLRNSNFDRILHRLPGHLRCFPPLPSFRLQLAPSMELQLRPVAPPAALLVAKLQSSPDIDSKPRPRLRTNLRIQLGFPPPAEPTAGFSTSLEDRVPDRGR